MSEFDKVILKRKNIGNTGKISQVGWKEALISFCNGKKYIGVAKGNEDIARLFSARGLSQEVFERAFKLREIAKEKKVPEHLLGEPLRDESAKRKTKQTSVSNTGNSYSISSREDIDEEENKQDNKQGNKEENKEETEVELIEKIEAIKEKTISQLNKTQKLLEETRKKIFSYEWLSKREASNGIIGLLCDCCAVIESEDYGKDIARATIIAPDVQNIVIRDRSGEIIAKAAIYLNKELGYMVINNFELNKKYRKTEIKDFYNGRYSGDMKDDSQKNDKERKEDEKRELIFQTFMRGIMDFVKKYNNLYPDKRIKQVNVGTGYNKLKKQIERFQKETKRLTVPAAYSFLDAMRYDQYILYKEEQGEEMEL